MSTTFRHARPAQEHRPLYVVWELTLKCDLACRHCGSRAGTPRRGELSLDECLDVVRQLAELGTQEITFIGGEAYLYPHWLEVVAATSAAGIRPTLTTGGRRLGPEVLQQAKAAGLFSASVSIDGLESTHDRLRAVPGSHRAALRTLENIRAAGIVPMANTQINQLNLDELEALHDTLMARAVRVWQVQLTGPMGRAADRPEWLLQPHQMLGLMPRLAALAEKAREGGSLVHAANNLGYYGPHEHVLRAAPWASCAAGRYILGIEADGSIKGCPSLPTAPYVGGSVRDHSLREIWENTAELAFTRERGTEDLWGHCASCYYARVCKGGCSWTSHTLLGRRGNMPYCHHRAIELQRRGLRERIELVEAAPGTPFDFGRYRLIEEPWPAG